jgi:hypothetical protein
LREKRGKRKEGRREEEKKKEGETYVQLFSLADPFEELIEHENWNEMEDFFLSSSYPQSCAVTPFHLAAAAAAVVVVVVVVESFAQEASE